MTWVAGTILLALIGGAVCGLLAILVVLESRATTRLRDAEARYLTRAAELRDELEQPRITRHTTAYRPTEPHPN